MKYRVWSLANKCIMIFVLASITACGPSNFNIEKMTALDAAIEVDLSPKKVKALLEGGSNPNQQSKSGYTPLIRASGELRVPRERKHLTPDQARNADEIVALLLAHGANPNLSTKDGRTALVVAVAANRPGAVAALLSNGASLETEMVGGDTPLSLAMHHCHLDLVKMLLERGANVTHKNSSGETVFEIARENCPLALSQLPQR